MKEKSAKGQDAPGIIIVGKLPPPYIGPAVATQIILNSRLKEEFELIHLDTSDHRDINTLGIIDLQNVYLALKQYGKLFWLLMTRWQAVVYLPNKQTTIGYLQDAPFILLAKLFRRKVICHLRGGDFKNWYDSAGVITRKLVQLVHPHIDGQIVLGQNLRHLFTVLLPASKLFVVPNGGNFAIKPKNKSKKTTILFLANLFQSKGVLDVLHTVPEINNHCSNVEFIFAGGWGNDGAQGKFAQFLEKEPKLPVVVKGPVSGERKYDLFAVADIFVFPTYYPPEGHPWVIVEAMAAGLPIITTDHAAITESVIDGVNGFIVPKQNPQAIAEKIKYLIENEPVRRKMGEESRRLYLQNFTEEKMVERLAHVFNTVLANGKL